LYLTYFNSAI